MRLGWMLSPGLRRGLGGLAVLPLMAAVDGTVLNRTTGKPQPNATVTLYKLGQAGMESVESVKTDGSGKFVLQATPSAGPHLVQAAFDGVTYNKMLPPGSKSTGLEVEVFASSPTAAGVAIKQHVFILEPADGKLQVSENIVYENSGNRAFNDPAGSVRFYLPPETQGKARIMCEGPRSMPIERTPKAVKDNVYAVDFPIKPGETRIQATYEMALGTPPVWAVKLLHKGGDVRLATPAGVTLKSANLKEIGREPRSQAVIYEASGQEIKAEIEGSGSIRGPEATSNDDSPKIEEVLPRLYDRWPLVVGLAAAILGIGLSMLYRADVPAAVAGKDSKRR